MNNIARANVKVVSQSSTGLNTKVSVNGHIMTNNQAYYQAKQGKARLMDTTVLFHQMETSTSVQIQTSQLITI